MDETSPSSALEQFRQQWQQEVKTKTQEKASTTSRTRRESGNTDGQPRIRPERPINRPIARHPLADVPDEVAPPSSPSSSKHSKVLKRVDRIVGEDLDEDEFAKLGQTEPKSAIEHYERAVEKEGQGNLGESLFHYRKAFRLDAKVDQIYKDKHFAHRWKPATTDSSSAVGTTAPSATPNSSTDQPVDKSKPIPTEQLIVNWSNEEIQGVPSIIEGDIPPPCPIKDLPTEVLLELLQHIARFDVSIFTRLASVCKKLAYHVYTETSIWKNIALGPEFGLGSQKYHFSTTVQGRPIIWQALDDADEDERPLPSITVNHFPVDQDWRECFHSHPRIRFTGVYISTVNYTRAGGTSITPATWTNSVHIVTYYRYLRFFRDGTVISLLTTHEPVEVVHLLTKENIVTVRATGTRHPPAGANSTAKSSSTNPDSKPLLLPTAQNVLKHALRGRWRLCHPSLHTTEIASNTALPGDLHIETEGGAGPRYMYTMHLRLTSGNPRNKHAVKNNKLTWKGFWSYNTLANDWAEFQLRNDKAFWFSRVKSYGLG